LSYTKQKFVFLSSALLTLVLGSKPPVINSIKFPLLSSDHLAKVYEGIGKKFLELCENIQI